MRRHALLAAVCSFLAAGAALAQAARETAGEKKPAVESVKEAAAEAAGEVSEAIEDTGKAVKKTLGMARTGCLIQGDETDPFILVEKDSGDRITVVGSAELPEHVGHTVTLQGREESDGRVFHATKVEHVAASCGDSGGEKSAVGRTGSADAARPAPQAGGVTADDQGLSAADRATTQSIRKAVVSDDTLSIAAKNVKIITRDGLVTLRGAVKTAAEKQDIEAKAAAVAGAANVSNELTVEAGGVPR